jgi:hypothetical protein
MARPGGVISHPPTLYLIPPFSRDFLSRSRSQTTTPSTKPVFVNHLSSSIMATKQKTRTNQAITLKGSTALVTEFFEYSVNS